MRPIIFAMSFTALAATAWGAELQESCVRLPATVIEIIGVNTAHARARAKFTEPDIVKACHEGYVGSSPSQCCVCSLRWPGDDIHPEIAGGMARNRPGNGPHSRLLERGCIDGRSRNGRFLAAARQRIIADPANACGAPRLVEAPSGEGFGRWTSRVYTADVTQHQRCSHGLHMRLCIVCTASGLTLA